MDKEKDWRKIACIAADIKSKAIHEAIEFLLDIIKNNNKEIEQMKACMMIEVLYVFIKEHINSIVDLKMCELFETKH